MKLRFWRAVWRLAKRAQIAANIVLIRLEREERERCERDWP